MKKFLSFLLSILFIPALLHAGATFSRGTTWSTGDTLTADALNAEFDNVMNNLTPAGIDDYSASAAQMRVVTDPFPLQSASLATSLQGELERMRYQILQLKRVLQAGTTYTNYWYEDLPENSAFTIRDSSVGINNSTPTVALDVVGSVKATSFVGSANLLTETLAINTNYLTYGNGVEIRDEGALLGGVTSFNLVGTNVSGSVGGKVLTLTVATQSSSTSIKTGLIVSTEGFNSNIVQATCATINIMGDFYVNYSTKADISKVGAGGLDVGAEQASIWYSIWAISNGTQAGILLSSATGNAPQALPTGYTKYTRLGYVKNNSSNFLGFMKKGNFVTYFDRQTALSTVSPATSLTDIDFSGVVSSAAVAMDLYIFVIETSGTTCQITFKDRNFNTANEPFIGFIAGSGSLRYDALHHVPVGPDKMKQYKQNGSTVDQVGIDVVSYTEE